MAAPIRKVTAPLARNVTSDLDLSVEALHHVLDLAAQMKSAPARFSKALTGRYISLLFEKPSLRTRFTFELAIKQLGGDAVTSMGPIGDREPVKDVARNLDRWTHGIVARVFSQKTIDELAQWSSVPVINALSDLYHPCQALADVLTLRERLGDLRGPKLAFVGDGNNVAHSLMLTATRLGMDFAVATPQGYEPDAEIVAQAAKFGPRHGHERSDRGRSTARDAIYTDVWTSMGQEDEAGARLRVFAAVSGERSAVRCTRAPTRFSCTACRPSAARKSTDAVMESPRSAVFDQAENRLHAQKALLVMLLG